VSALDAEQITEVLSAPAVVDELARHGQTDAVHRLLSVLSRAQQARVLSAPLAVVGLVRGKVSAARVLLVIEALEPAQRLSVWATPGVAKAFLAPGFEARVVAELECLSAAQLGQMLNLRVLIQLLTAGYVSQVMRWLSALSPAPPTHTPSAGRRAASRGHAWLPRMRQDLRRARIAPVYILQLRDAG
jgi:hypothetical protein